MSCRNAEQEPQSPAPERRNIVLGVIAGAGGLHWIVNQLRSQAKFSRQQGFGAGAGAGAGATGVEPLLPGAGVKAAGTFPSELEPEAWESVHFPGGGVLRNFPAPQLW